MAGFINPYVADQLYVAPPKEMLVGMVDRAQNRYDNTASAMAADKAQLASIFTFDPESKSALMQEYKNTLDKRISDNNGDLSQAMNAIKGDIADFRNNEWFQGNELLTQAKKQEMSRQEALRAAGKELTFKTLTPSVYRDKIDENGNVIGKRVITANDISNESDIQERLDYQRQMSDIWNSVKADAESGRLADYGVLGETGFAEIFKKAGISDTKIRNMADAAYTSYMHTAEGKQRLASLMAGNSGDYTSPMDEKKAIDTIKNEVLKEGQLREFKNTDYDYRNYNIPKEPDDNGWGYTKTTALPTIVSKEYGTMVDNTQLKSITPVFDDKGTFKTDPTFDNFKNANFPSKLGELMAESIWQATGHMGTKKENATVKEVIDTYKKYMPEIYGGMSDKQVWDNYMENQMWKNNQMNTEYYLADDKYQFSNLDQLQKGLMQENSLKVRYDNEHELGRDDRKKFMDENKEKTLQYSIDLSGKGFKSAAFRTTDSNGKDVYIEPDNNIKAYLQPAYEVRQAFTDAKTPFKVINSNITTEDGTGFVYVVAKVNDNIDDKVVYTVPGDSYYKLMKAKTLDDLHDVLNETGYSIGDMNSTINNHIQAVTRGRGMVTATKSR
jgi:hypothetical protein